MADSQIRALARRIAALEKAKLHAKQPNLGFSTIEGGGAIQATDETDTLTMVVGQQFDGTNTAAVVTGPTPPSPTLPLVTAQPGAIRVYWDGTFAGGAVAPMDFARVLAYAEPVSSYDGPDPLNQAYIIGEFNTATGGEITAALPGGIEYVVYFVTWTQAGKFGPASLATTGMPGFAVSSEEVADKASVYRQDTAPWPDGATGHADDVGDLWFNTSLGPGEIWGVLSWSVTGGVVTMILEGEHDMAVANLVEITGPAKAAPIGSEEPTVPILGLEGTWTVTAVTSTSISFTPETSFPDQAAEPMAAGVARGQDVKPLNRPSIWDGTAWRSVQDSDLDNASTLAPQVKVNEQTLATLQTTAHDAYRTAYAADGRISISDYEPTAADVPGKQPGSMWITRTRDRLNRAPNPSFEVNTTGWAAVRSSIARVAASVAGDGAYALQVTNDSSTSSGEHYAHITPRLPVVPGEDIIASAYFKSISGAAGGADICLSFRDSGGTEITAVVGDPVTMLTTDWVRPFVTAKAPAGAVDVSIMFRTPQASADAVWLLDAVLVEGGTFLGRYFDGGSEGGSWIGTPENSTSELDGNAIIKFFTLEDSTWTQKFWTADTISSVSASVIDRGEMNGAFIEDNTVAVDKFYSPEVPAGEGLTAGNLVHVTKSQGVTVALKADAAAGRRANGFVLSTVGTGELVKVYSTGYNPLMSGMSPGAQWLGAGGACQSVPPTMTAGTIVQRVGFATDAATLVFQPANHIAIV